MLLSASTAVSAPVLGAVLAWLIVSSPPTSVLRRAVISLCSVLAQFGGVALAFAFLATIGLNGVLTLWVQQHFGWNLAGSGWLYSLPGLVLVYTYFQIPLMVIVFLPALEGLREQWREAAVSLGASTCQYWRQVAVPLLTPAFLGSFLLLFANAFAAYATAAALVSQGSPILPLLIRAALTSEVVLGQSGFAYALALEMIVIVAAVMVAYNAARATHREVAAVRRTTLGGKVFRGALLAAFGLFFLFPLYAMADFSTRNLLAGGRTMAAWKNLIADDALYQAIVISLLLAVLTVVLMLLILVPTMIWVRLRAPWAKGIVEFLCLLPLTIPALVIVVGLRNVYLWVTYFLGESALTLTFVYVVLVLPFAYRAIDAALSAIDLKTLSEAARSLGAGWLTTIARVVVPNIWSGILSAAFISVAVVLGEYTIASLSGFETLQIQIVALGKSDGPTSVAASLATLRVRLRAAARSLAGHPRRRRTTAADPAVAAPTPATQTGVPT